MRARACRAAARRARPSPPGAGSAPSRRPYRRTGRRRPAPPGSASSRSATAAGALGARRSNCLSRQARVSSTRSPERSNVGSSNGVVATTAERVSAHADRVDLVDEDDALAAPFPREALRLAREIANEDRVEPDERLREAGARDGHERRVEPGCDRLREHRLAGAGRAEEEQAALALAARLLEALAGLPEGDDAPDLLLRLGLAANVLELHAPFGVTGLVAADLRDAHGEHRAQEDQEVRRGRRAAA